MSERVDMILDLETLGVTPGAVVVQVGAVAFRRQGGGQVATFLQNIDIGTCLASGLEIEASTLAWWRKQTSAARMAVFAPMRPALIEVVTAWRRFWREAGCGEDSCLWARGADFDPPIWAAAMRAADGLDPPWRYARVRDTRTAFDLLEFDPKAVPMDGVAHTALADCLHDLSCLRRAGAFA